MSHLLGHLHGKPILIATMQLSLGAAGATGAAGGATGAAGVGVALAASNRLQRGARGALTKHPSVSSVQLLEVLVQAISLVS